MKERERFLEAEMERNRDQKHKKPYYQMESDNHSIDKHRERRSLSQGNNPPLLPRDNIKLHNSPEHLHAVHKEPKGDAVSVDVKKIRSGIPKYGRQQAPIDYNNRQVTYHDDATPLHPKGQPLEQILQQQGTSSSSVGGRNSHPAMLASNSVDETGGLFSPIRYEATQHNPNLLFQTFCLSLSSHLIPPSSSLSPPSSPPPLPYTNTTITRQQFIISMASMGGDSRYSSGNSKKNKGKFGNGNVMIPGTHLVDISGHGDNDDDDSGIQVTVAPITTTAHALRSPKEDNRVFSNRKKIKQYDKKDVPDGGSDNGSIGSNRSVFPSPDPHHVPVFGDQYVADVLETEKGKEN